MALITQLDFAKTCGISRQNLTTYIKRGKVILSRNKKVNDKNLTNVYFYKNRLELIKEKKDDPTTRLSLDKRIKAAELKKKEVDTRIALLKEEKMKGEVIPTDLIKILFTQHSKYIITEFENSLDKVLTILAKEFKMNNKAISKYRGVIKKEINVAVDKTTDMTKKNIQNIIDEFTEKRSRGEKK